MNIPEIIANMTLEEKSALCTGSDFWHTKAMPQHGIPAIKMSDGPHGVRCQQDAADMIGINESLPATCFPTAVTAGATWNRELYAQEGEAIGREACAAGVSVVLAGMPAASVTAILASKYEGDETFATQCVVFTTILSMATIPLWCLILA